MNDEDAVFFYEESKKEPDNLQNLVPGEELRLTIPQVERIECVHGFLESEVSIELSNFKMKILHSQKSANG